MDFLSYENRSDLSLYLHLWLLPKLILKSALGYMGVKYNPTKYLTLLCKGRFQKVQGWGIWSIIRGADTYILEVLGSVNSSGKKQTFTQNVCCRAAMDKYCKSCFNHYLVLVSSFPAYRLPHLMC